MGVTVDCAQCHEHKYDPISQDEYFRLFAIFNQTEDSDKRRQQPEPAVPASRGRRRRRPAWETELADAREGDRPKSCPISMQRQQAVGKGNAGRGKLAKLPANVQAILKIAAAKRNPAQKEELDEVLPLDAPEISRVASAR